MCLIFENMSEHPTYTRLMLAAKELKNINKNAQLARGLQTSGWQITSQTLNNWRTRGVPTDKFMDLADWLGCDPYWLRDNKGSMVNISYVISDKQLSTLKAMQKIDDYKQDILYKFAITLTDKPSDQS